MTANAITSTLLIELPKRFRCRAWRSNVVVAMIKGQCVRAGVNGQADISGIIAPLGIRLEVEVKAGKDRMSPAQRNFSAMIRAHGGVYIEARSVEQACADLAARLAELERAVTPAAVTPAAVTPAAVTSAAPGDKKL